MRPSLRSAALPNLVIKLWMTGDWKLMTNVYSLLLLCCSVAPLKNLRTPGYRKIQAAVAASAQSAPPTQLRSFVSRARSAARTCGSRDAAVFVSCHGSLAMS